MSWIKQANKLGRYETTYRGFRVYCTKEPQTIERTEVREDGTWHVTDFIRGEWVAVDKTGSRVEGSGLEDIGFKIDIEILKRP